MPRPPVNPHHRSVFKALPAFTAEHLSAVKGAVGRRRDRGRFTALPTAFFASLHRIIGDYRYQVLREGNNPSRASVHATIEAIRMHARALRTGLGTSGDEAGGAIRLLVETSWAMEWNGNDLIAESRNMLDALNAACLLATCSTKQTVGRPPGRFEFQTELAARIARALDAQGIRPTATYRKGRPASAYTRLVNFALVNADIRSKAKRGKQLGSEIRISSAGLNRYKAAKKERNRTD